MSSDISRRWRCSTEELSYMFRLFESYNILLAFGIAHRPTIAIFPILCCRESGVAPHVTSPKAKNVLPPLSMLCQTVTAFAKISRGSTVTESVLTYFQHGFDISAVMVVLANIRCCGRSCSDCDFFRVSGGSGTCFIAPV